MQAEHNVENSLLLPRKVLHNNGFRLSVHFYIILPATLTYKKKLLSQRIHQCTCGVGPVDRDVYSAFLAYHVNLVSNTLDIGAARAAFATLQCGAVDIQATPQAASAIPSQGTPSPRARGEQSDSPAERALLP